MSEATKWKLVPVDPTNEQMEAMQDHDYEASIYWAAIAAAPPPPIPPARLAEMREAANTYGPANCWTGTTGTLAAMVRELLELIGEERE